MTDKTEEQIAKERASVQAMKNAQATMGAVLERNSALERALIQARDDLNSAKQFISDRVYMYASGGSSQSVHARIDEQVARASKAIGQ